ncbi:Thiamine biosynthesis lipoprotein ApbE precursor [compost metagenome]
MKTFTEGEPLQRYSLSGPTMGSRFAAVFYAAAGLDTQPIQAELQGAVDRVDGQMSTWKPDSTLMRLNRAPLGEWFELPDELYQVLLAGLHVGSLSHGAFDIALGAQVSAWGFGPAPASAVESPCCAATTALTLDPARQAVRKEAEVSLDLNGIAKGFGVDELARSLERHGIQRYLVGIDGELRARGEKPDGAWRVALETPAYGRREVFASLELADAAIATSGDYRHWRERDGQRYSHTLDPHSGAPLHNGIASVSVLSGSCLYADAWATALMVLGVERGARLAREQGLGAVFLVREGEHIREVTVGL